MNIAEAARAAASLDTRGSHLLYPALEHFSGVNSLSFNSAAMEHYNEGNTIQSTAELVDCHNVFVSSAGPRVSIIGLDDAIVVVDEDEVLVTARAGAQRIGKLTGAINQ